MPSTPSNLISSPAGLLRDVPGPAVLTAGRTSSVPAGGDTAGGDGTVTGMTPLKFQKRERQERTFRKEGNDDEKASK